jgi:hypothetical protein
LDEIGQRQALILVTPCVGGDQAQIGIDEQFLRVQVAALDALCQVDLLGRGEQGIAPGMREQLIDRLGDEGFRGAQRNRLGNRIIEPLGLGEGLLDGTRPTIGRGSALVARAGGDRI